MQEDLEGELYEPEVGPLYTADRTAVRQNDYVRTEMSCLQVARKESRKRINMKQTQRIYVQTGISRIRRERESWPKMESNINQYHADISHPIQSLLMIISFRGKAPVKSGVVQTAL